MSVTFVNLKRVKRMDELQHNMASIGMEGLGKCFSSQVPEMLSRPIGKGT